MMDPLLLVPRSPRQDQFITLANELAERFAPHVAQHDHEASFPLENFTTLVATRYHALTVPERYGGLGATLLEAVLAQEHLARGDGATALVIDMPIHIVGAISDMQILHKDQFERICRTIVEDKALINLATSEPQLGSSTRGGLPSTTAHHVSGGWRINGRKCFISGSPVMTHLLVSATLEGTSTLGVFFVPRNLPGVCIEQTWDTLGMRATASNDLLLEEVQVGDDNLLVQREPGTPFFGKNGNAWFWLTIAAVYLGIGVAARDAAIKYAVERRPTNLNGQSIISTDSVQRRLGMIEARLLAARSVLYNIADAWDRNPESRNSLHPYLGACKVTATTAVVEATDLALQIVGGVGMSCALPFERFIRDARAGQFHPPAEDTAHSLLGKAVAAFQNDVQNFSRYAL